jgi:hypothetical protein
MPILDNISQKWHSEEMISNVPRIEQQSSIWASFLSRCQRNLTIFYHLVHSIHSANHANWFCRVRFLYHLPIRKDNNRGRNFIKCFFKRLAIIKGHVYNFADIVFKVLSQEEPLALDKQLSLYSLRVYFPTRNEVYYSSLLVT